MPRRSFPAAIVMLALAALMAVARAEQDAPLPLSVADARAGQRSATESGHAIVTAGLFDWLFGDRSREHRREPPAKLEPAPEDRRSGTYRTLCVRLCDGFYFPISYATRRDRFEDDAKRCEQSCPSRSRLFVHRNPGEGFEDMTDLEGQPYRALPNAFKHQTQYVADCTCRGNPWDQAALARHRAFAEEHKQKANKVADQQPPKAQPHRRVILQSSSAYRPAGRDDKGD